MKLKYHILLATVLIALFNCTVVFGEPPVIYDAGSAHTKPITEYLRIFAAPTKFTLPRDPKVKQRIIDDLKARAAAAGTASGVQVPIITPSLHPGAFRSRDAFFPNLIQPLFIVGSDPRSLAWLKQWRDVLYKLGAIGWVVQAHDAADLKAIATAGHGMKFMAMSGKGISHIFGIKTYPVLISQRAIEQ